MGRKRLSDMNPERRKELKRQYRKPPTAAYRTLRVVRVACLLAALLCAYFATPLSPLGEDHGIVFAVIGNVLIIGAIVLDATKMRSLREEYIEEVLNSKTKESRKAQKAARAEERAKARQDRDASVEDMLADESLSYWDRLRLSARLSAQAAQESPREK